MGAAKENRDRAKARRDADAITQANQFSQDVRWMRDTLADEKRARLTAEKELERARACIARLRSTLTMEREQRHETETALRADRLKWLREALYMREKWVYLSKMIRALVSPAQYLEYREEFAKPERAYKAAA